MSQLTDDALSRRSLLKAKLREGIDRLPLEGYDLSLDTPECVKAWLDVEEIAGRYVKGEKSLLEVREAFHLYVSAHEIAPKLF